MGLEIKPFVDPIYGQNSRVVYPIGNKEVWIIDPGLPPVAEEILEFLESVSLRPAAILLTHAHADHIAGIPQVLAAWPGLSVYLARREWDFLADPSQNLSGFVGLPLRIRVQPSQLLDLPEGQMLNLGGTQWQILDTAGHSPGGRTFYCPDEQTAIVGDSLFAGSVGRTDFPHSDGRLLFANIREKLFSLPDPTRVYAGHGPETTIGIEKKTNPFVGRHTTEVM